MKQMEEIKVNDGKCSQCHSPATKMYRDRDVSRKWMFFCSDHDLDSYDRFTRSAVKEADKQYWFGPYTPSDEICGTKNMNPIDYITEKTERVNEQMYKL